MHAPPYGVGRHASWSQSEGDTDSPVFLLELEGHYTIPDDQSMFTVECAYGAFSCRIRLADPTGPPLLVDQVAVGMG